MRNFAALLIMLFVVTAAGAEDVRVASPDGRLTVTLTVDGDGLTAPTPRRGTSPDLHPAERSGLFLSLNSAFYFAVNRKWSNFAPSLH